MKPIITPVFNRFQSRSTSSPSFRPTIHPANLPATNSPAGQSLANSAQTQLQQQYQQTVVDRRKLAAITDNAPAVSKDFWQAKSDLTSRRLDHLQSQLDSQKSSTK